MSEIKFNFRIRFNLPQRLHIKSSETELSISAPTEAQQIILKSTEKGKNIEESRRLALIGGRYPSETEAKNAAEKWRASIEAAFPYMGLGADLGDRAYSSVLTPHGIKWAEQTEGRRVLNDTHGVMVYKTEPAPLFGYTKIDVTIGKPSDETAKILKHAYAIGVSSSTEEKLAFDLYAASFSQPAVDSRFLTLMMAVETLAKRNLRDKSSIDHLDKLIQETRDSGLPDVAKNSIASALKDLKLQSIGSACVELALKLNKLKYSNMESFAFIKKCYSLRSQLIHGSNPRPSRETVDSLVTGLEIFVAHLLSQKLGKPFREQK